MMMMLAAAALAADCLVIEGATVHLPEGPAPGVSVRVAGGRVEALGPALPTEGCRVVDGRGRQLTPGMVDAHTQLGLIEVGMVSATADHGGGRPSYQVIDGYNPRSTLIPVARLAGTTTAIAVPSGGLVAGQGAAFRMAGATQAEALLQPSVAFYATLGDNIGQGLDALDLLFDDARDWAANRAAYERNATRAYSAPPRDLAALQPLLRGELPLVVEVDRASDIEAALRFADARGLRLVILGGTEAWMHAAELAAAGVPVIVDPYVHNPGTFNQLHARPDNAALLHAAGVDLIIASRSAHFARGLRQLAGNAVREGLPHAAALEAISATPARVFGLAGAGVIAEGAAADLALWSGDPLELDTRLELLLIGGREVPLESRQTLLRDRYLTLPGSPPAPLPLPASE